MKKLFVVLNAAFVLFAEAENVKLVCEAVGDSGSVVRSVEPDADGHYASGVSVTFTATGANGSEFVKWVGTLADSLTDEQLTANPLTVTVEEAGTLVPLFTGMWLYEVREDKTTEGRLTEVVPASVTDSTHRWILNVHGMDSTARTLKLGTGDYVSMNAVYQVNKSYELGSAKLDMSTAVCDKDGNLWKIISSYSGGYSFAQWDVVLNKDRPNDNPAMEEFNGLKIGCVKEVIMPRTLKSLGGQAFNGVRSNIEVLIFDCPELESGFPAYAYGGQDKVKRLVLKCPKLKTIAALNSMPRPLSETNVDEWDLSGLESLNEKDETWGGFPGDRAITGTLRLPKIKKIGRSAFSGSQTLTAIELGCGGGTVERVSFAAFGGNFYTKKLVISGSNNGWIMSTNAISLKKSTPNIIFNCEVAPTNNFGGKFIYNEAKALSTCIYVPNSYSWCEALGDNLQAATEEEKDGYLAVNTDAVAPTEILPAGEHCFGTTYSQFIGSGKMRDFGVMVDFHVSVPDPRYGDTVSLTVNGETKTGTHIHGFYPAGTEVTITANCKAGNTPHWKGLPHTADGKSDNKSETFVINDGEMGERFCKAELWSRHPWKFIPESDAYPTNTITDGIWTINVTKSATEGELYLGLPKDIFHGNAYVEGKGDGILDLNGPITDAEGNTYRHVAVYSRAFGMRKNFSTIPSMLVFPETLTAFWGQVMNGSGDWPHCNILTNIVMDLPLLTGGIVVWFTSGHWGIKTFTVNVPNVSKISGPDSIGFGVGLDRSEWCFDSVTTLNVGVNEAGNPNGEALKGWGSYALVSSEETLHFPKLLSAAAGALVAQNIHAFEFGTAYEPKSGKTLTLKTGSVKNNAFTKKIVFGAYSDFAFDEGAFTKCSGLRDISFLGFAPENMNTNLDRLLESVPASDDGNLQTRIHVSKLLNWDKLASTTNGAESVMLQKMAGKYKFAKNVFGVYQTKDGERKAWLVHTPSEYDPKGTIFIIR